MYLVAWLLAEGCHGADRVGLTPDAAVRALVAADGLAVTVDEVAELDGVSKAANDYVRCPCDAHRYPHPRITVRSARAVAGGDSSALPRRDRGEPCSLGPHPTVSLLRDELPERHAASRAHSNKFCANTGLVTNSASSPSPTARQRP